MENLGEIHNYQQASPTTMGDAAMGNKSNHVYSNSVSWIDTGGNAHSANFDQNNQFGQYYCRTSDYGSCTSAGPTAGFQSFARGNANNWSTWDNRCG